MFISNWFNIFFSKFEQWTTNFECLMERPSTDRADILCEARTKIKAKAGNSSWKILWQDIKKGVTKNSNALILISTNHYFLCLGSDETVNLCLPLALRRARTFLPFAEAILSINPCLFLLFLFDGWNVLLLIALYL